MVASQKLHHRLTAGTRKTNSLRHTDCSLYPERNTKHHPERSAKHEAEGSPAKLLQKTTLATQKIFAPTQDDEELRMDSQHLHALDLFLKAPPFEHSKNAELWSKIASLEDSFGDRSVDTPDIQVHPLLPTLKTHNSSYLPIEFLRGERSLKLYQGLNAPARHFLSSGTTASTRSQSYYSHDGLLLYKAQSLKIFRDVLRRFFTTRNVMQVKGISLVPTSTEWPSSSLAQMLTWIAEYWPVEFVSPEEFAKYTLDTRSEALWVFATPFQLIHLMDAGCSWDLPKDSIVFETGGTKGQSRSLQRDDLYDLIAERFHIPPTSIVSEYGMCELATQAYDFVDAHKERHFRFPSWVKVSALAGLDLPFQQGEGALLVHDPLRIDYPWPLRTQDLCHLKEDASFALLGRVTNAVLKGCSLLTEIQEDKAESITQMAKPWQTTSLLAAHGTTLSALTQELGSGSAARFALEGLEASVPQDWNEAIQRSCAREGEHWLFVLPNNHSLVAVYPLRLAVEAGLKISVRIPKNFAHAHSFLNHFLNELNTRTPITFFSADQRIGEAKLPDGVDRICIYGDDATVQHVQKYSPVSVKAFGTGITISTVTSFSTKNAHALAKDFLSLGQRGCLSTRAVFVAGDWDRVQEFLSKLRDACRLFWNADLTSMQRTALDHEDLGLRELGFVCTPRQSLDDVVIASIYRESAGQDLWKLLSPQAFVLPVFYFGEDRERMLAEARAFPSLVCISACEESLKDLTFPNARALGTANTPSWDGLHNGTPLFD